MFSRPHRNCLKKLGRYSIRRLVFLKFRSIPVNSAWSSCVGCLTLLAREAANHSVPRSPWHQHRPTPFLPNKKWNSPYTRTLGRQVGHGRSRLGTPDTRILLNSGDAPNNFQTSISVGPQSPTRTVQNRAKMGGENLGFWVRSETAPKSRSL
ncbi:hypothetical protein C8F04DRAFT_1100714 [Mycena alexandri]|uniref:Uncharacterized protein n=1 Tax=Mycena alexandri TaxID=1745969 RepID=A0AAD6SW02_9AGAR|nr:hypothetical protein C8F04DRAFT_1100714 [Mycena alexandri]